MAVRESLPGPRLLLSSFFGVAFRKQTYLNLVYLSLTFPLGLTYFVFLTTGLSVSVSLIIIIVGVPLLLGVILLASMLVAGERLLATHLLGIDIPTDDEDQPDDPIERLKDILLDRTTWTGIVYLASKFVIGLASFIYLVVAGSFSAAFIATPLYYQNATTGVFLSEPLHVAPSLVYQVDFWKVSLTVPLTLTSWYVNTLPEALVASAFGFLVLLVSFHVANLFAKLTGWYTMVMLGRPTQTDEVEKFRRWLTDVRQRR